MNNRKTALYQMLTIRNHVASDARMRAAHTTAVPPDSDTKMSEECIRFSASGCFMRALTVWADEIETKKGFGFPKPFWSPNERA
ncbi:MAG: hypothetical protein ACRC9K_07025 [Afipia sp.]